MHYVCIFFHIVCISAEIWIFRLISQGIVATCLRWGGRYHMGFVTNFIRFPAVQKVWESVKRWQSYRELKGGNFFETQCSFVCFLFVTLTVCVSLGYRRAHCEGYIAAIYRSILMQSTLFLEEETLCRICQKHLNYILRWRHICLGIRSKFGIFSKFERQSLCARLRPFKRRMEKEFYTAY